MSELHDYKSELERIHNKIDQLEKKIINDIFQDILKRLPEKKTYDIAQFCEITGLDSDTVTRYCNEGYLEATQLSKRGKWIIKASEIDRITNEAMANRRKDLSSTAKRDNIILKNLSTKKTGK